MPSSESDELSPAPKGADEEVLEARRKAVDALLFAEESEQAAHRARRIARSKQKHYERLVQENMGQLSILEVQ